LKELLLLLLPLHHPQINPVVAVEAPVLLPVRISRRHSQYSLSIKNTSGYHFCCCCCCCYHDSSIKDGGDVSFFKLLVLAPCMSSGKSIYH